MENGHDHLDILKMDVEGTEYDIFDEWCEDESAWPSFDQLLVEVHYNGIIATDNRFDAFNKCMRRSGFELFYREENLATCLKGIRFYAVEFAWVRLDSEFVTKDSPRVANQEAKHQKYTQRRQEIISLMEKKNDPWCAHIHKNIYFWDLFVPFDATPCLDCDRAPLYVASSKHNFTSLHDLVASHQDRRAAFRVLFDLGERHDLFVDVSNMIRFIEGSGYRLWKRQLARGECGSKKKKPTTCLMIFH